MTPDERTRPVASIHPATERRQGPDVGRAVMDAADAIADMAQRVQRNGPEPVYASEKLAWEFYRAAEALALCGVALPEATAEVHRGYDHGLHLQADPAGVPAREPLLIVSVHDEINPHLIGRSGASYVSPPQRTEQARAARDS